MATQSSLYLPIELWCMVFEQLDGDGVGELWMTYRHVCKAWRTAAELAFQVHLPNIRIDFEPQGRYNYRDFMGRDFTHARVVSYFDRLADDRILAHFKFQTIHPSHWYRVEPDMNYYIEKSWLSGMDTLEPHHYIQIHQHLNDTPIYGLSFDWENRVFACDWRKTISAFYREESCYNTLIKKQTTNREGMKSLDDSLRMDVRERSYECRKVVRRARFREIFRNELGMDNWDNYIETAVNFGGEASVLESLKERRQRARFELIDSGEESRGNGSDDESRSLGIAEQVQEKSREEP